LAANYVYFASRDGSLYVLKQNKSGALAFSYALGGQPDSSPAVAANKLYVCGDKLICFKK
jgi:outer membrane protein assembly factor BamB